MPDADLLALFGPEEISTGIMPDLPNSNPRLFEDGRNVVFTDGSVQPILRQAVLVTARDAGPAAGLIDANVNEVPSLFWGSSSRLYHWTEAGGALVVGSGYSSELWSLVKWGDWIVGTNGVDSIQRWISPSFTALTGDPPTTAEVLVRRSPYLLALNTNRGGEYIEWCHRDDVTIWTPTTSNEAGRLPVRDLSGPIRAGISFRGEAVAATSDELILIQYIGPPYIFGNNVAVRGAGVWGKYSICEAQGMLYGMGPRGIWKSDLSSYQYFDDPMVREFVYEDINAEAAHRSVAWYDKVHSLMTFWYPSEGEDYPNRGVAVDVRTGAWTILSYGRTGAADTGVFSFSALLDSLGTVTHYSVLEPEERPGYLPLSPLAEVFIGYGESGYGEGGYGGIEVDG